MEAADVGLLTLWAGLNLVAFVLGTFSNVYGFMRVLRGPGGCSRQHLLLLTLLLVGAFICCLHTPLSAAWLCLYLASEAATSRWLDQLSRVAEALWSLGEVIFYVNIAFLALHRCRVISNSLANFSYRKSALIIAGQALSWTLGVSVLAVELASQWFSWAPSLCMLAQLAPPCLCLLALLTMVLAYSKVLCYVYKADPPDHARYITNYQRFYEMTRSLRSSHLRSNTIHRHPSDVLATPDVFVSRSSRVSQSHIGGALAPALMGAALEPLNLMLTQSKTLNRSGRSFRRRRSSLDISRTMSIRRNIAPSPIPEADFSLPGCVEEEVKSEQDPGEGGSAGKPQLLLIPSHLEEDFGNDVSTFTKEQQVGYYLQKMSTCKKPSQDMTFESWAEKVNSRASSAGRSTAAAYGKQQLKVPKWHGPKSSVFSRCSAFSSSISTASTLTMPSSSHEKRCSDQRTSGSYVHRQSLSDRASEVSLGRSPQPPPLFRSCSLRSLPSEWRLRRSCWDDTEAAQAASSSRAAKTCKIKQRKSLIHFRQCKISPTLSTKGLPAKKVVSGKQAKPVNTPPPCSSLQFSFGRRAGEAGGGRERREEESEPGSVKDCDAESLSVVSMTNSDTGHSRRQFRKRRGRDGIVGKSRKRPHRRRKPQQPRERLELPGTRNTSTADLPPLRHEKGINEKEFLELLDSPVHKYSLMRAAWAIEQPTEQPAAVAAAAAAAAAEEGQGAGHDGRGYALDAAVEMETVEGGRQDECTEVEVATEETLLHIIQGDEEPAPSSRTTASDPGLAHLHLHRQSGAQAQEQEQVHLHLSTPCDSILLSDPNLQSSRGTKQSLNHTLYSSPRTGVSLVSDDPLEPTAAHEALCHTTGLSEAHPSLGQSMQPQLGPPREPHLSKFRVTLRKTALIVCHFVVLVLPYAVSQIYDYFNASQVADRGSHSRVLIRGITQSAATLAFALFPHLYVFNNKTLMKRS